MCEGAPSPTHRTGAQCRERSGSEASPARLSGADSVQSRRHSGHLRGPAPCLPLRPGSEGTGKAVSNSRVMKEGRGGSFPKHGLHPQGSSSPLGKVSEERGRQGTKSSTDPRFPPTCQINKFDQAHSGGVGARGTSTICRSLFWAIRRWAAPVCRSQKPKQETRESCPNGLTRGLFRNLRNSPRSPQLVSGVEEAGRGRQPPYLCRHLLQALASRSALRVHQPPLR